MLRRMRWLPAVTLVATMAGFVPSSPSLADGGTAPQGKRYTVTLLTGDAVTVEITGTGCPRVTIEPVNPNGVVQQSCGPDGHVHVIPASVAAQIGPVLDPTLFDVTALIHDGYDDASTSELPLIVQPKANARMAVLGDVRQLSSIGAVAGRVPKKTPATAKAAGDSLLAGAAKVWLDRKVQATTFTNDLDRNLPQISAPEAWDAGYTGKGTRVAVLDSGADFTHPDLAGQVVDRADFIVEGGDAVDHKGHGTHVATTIAGTGAASHGQRRGVAPGARLVIGKVLDDNGFGEDSGIIAGMEWAAARADVINMSLGGEEASDGTDPLSLAVDALSKQTGALFVVSAGNNGGAISSPGAARSALTVGAVDAADKLAGFSSRGPIVNTHVAKPELVAPGVDIVAGRASGTTMGDPIDQYYTSSDGTSMASPHVAGAAALLAQRHPDWTAERLKAGLVGAADPMPDVDRYAVGAGRLNAARALSGPVSNQPVVALGTFPYPQKGSSTANLSWTGDSNSASTDLDLDVTVTDHAGSAAPRHTASLSETRVRLKRGASAGTTLRIDRSALAGKPGFYTAVVTARSHGKLVSTTPVSFYVEVPSYDLTIKTVATRDKPEAATDWVGLLVTNLDDPTVYGGGDFDTPGKTVTLRVPAGRYAVTGAYTVYDPETDNQQGSLVGDPDIAVTADRVITLDPARAKPVTATVEKVATTTSTTQFTTVQTSRSGLGWTQSTTGFGSLSKVSVEPMERPGIGTFQSYSGFALDSTGNSGTPAHYDLVHAYDKGVPADPTYRVTKKEQSRLARIDQRFNQMDSDGMVTSLRRSGYTSDGFAFVLQNRTYDLPVNRTDYVTPGYIWKDEGIYGGLTAAEGDRAYQAGSKQSKIWARQPLHSDWYDDPSGAEFSCATAPSRTSGNLHVDLVMLTDQHQRADCLAAGTIGVNRKLSLYRDGKLVEERAASLADFTVPSSAADYRLTFDVETGLILPISTKVNTSWTFRSAGPSGTRSVPLPLLSIDYALPLDAANHPTGGAASFHVRQANGTPTQRVESFQVWTSTDDGAWRSARVNRDGDGYRAELPTVKAGQAVSLRVKAGASGGSGIEQTIIRAYHAG
ncbi:subtilase family protein [Micromonospora pisi]|uniref:Subtilase family protein n=1 Tax=Micromonospora pisi TaxID=589240 RepID=A0A495JE12_9ACTN|nr:S8 family serine peptidase [Micromonospora pisi]RKR86971.1 subtilase family protein [Micromonospora pisi]